MLIEALIRFLFKKSGCLHEKITPLNAGQYCPDCGREVIISWSVLRCCSCSCKRPAGIYLNAVIPTEKHCIRCGSRYYNIEKKNSIELFELEYAVITREETGNIDPEHSRTQIWIDKESLWRDYIKPGLIPLLSK